MIVLAIDSCGAACAVCVWRDGAAMAAKTEVMQRGQDARLLPLVVEMLQAAQITFQQLDRIAVTRGPGSFTGLRVGLAAARGIGMAAGKPVIGIDRFQIYRTLAPDGALLVVLESKRAELFCRFFPAAGLAHDPAALTPAQIDAFIQAHPGTHIAGDRSVSDQQAVIACAKLAAGADPGDALYSPTPLYLRAPDVTLPAPAPFSASAP